MTRASSPAGTSDCTAVNQNVLNIVPELPSMNATGRMTGSGACPATRANSVGVTTAKMAKESRKGWRGRARRAMMPPATEPAPRATAIAAHAPGPPSDSRAICGPSTCHGAQAKPMYRVKQATVTHSQRRARNAPQPWRSSCNSVARTRTSAMTGGIARTQAALARKVTASKARPHPGSAAATITPATAGPATAATLPVNASRLLAR